MACQAAAHRRARPGRVTRVEAVDIERHVDRPRAELATNLGDDAVDAEFVHLRSVDDVEPRRIRILRAQADLHGAGWIDDALPGRPVKHRAVIDAVVLVAPGIAVRVEMQQ